MVRRIAVVLLITMILAIPHAVWAATGVRVVIGGAEILGVIDEASRTLVPARTVAESLQAAVQWDPATQTVTIVQGPTVITLTIGSKEAQVNGRQVELDCNAVISPEGSTLVPLRFIAEALGQKVTWDATTQTVVLKDAALSELPLQPNLVGNSMSNLQKGGWAARQGDWIFFSNFAAKLRLYRMRVDGSGVRPVGNDAGVMEINVVGEWVYYIEANHGAYQIKKARLDGSGSTTLGNGGARDMRVIGDQVYYIDQSDGNRIYRMRTDGTGRTRLNDLYSQGLLVEGDWIYYVGRVEGNDSLHRVRTDGTGEEQVLAELPWGVFLVRGQVYYQRPISWVDRQFSLVRMVPGTADGETVAAAFSPLWAVNDDQWFYYADKNSAAGGPLTRMRVDGTGNQQLTAGTSARISLLGDWLLYENGENAGSVYRIKTDGTGKSLLDGDTWRDVP